MCEEGQRAEALLLLVVFLYQERLSATVGSFGRPVMPQT
jgi:hypothetical protein